MQLLHLRVFGGDGVRSQQLVENSRHHLPHFVDPATPANLLNQDYPYNSILYGVIQPFKINHYHSDNYYAERTVLGSYNDLPFYRGTAYVVNSRDGIREGDTTQTPLQFVYEPADCRIYYTHEMVVDQEAVWKSVADTGQYIPCHISILSSILHRPTVQYAAFVVLSLFWRGCSSPLCSPIISPRPYLHFTCRAVTMLITPTRTVPVMSAFVRLLWI